MAVAEATFIKHDRFVHYITRMLSNALLNFMLCFVARPLQKPPLYSITALHMMLFFIPIPTEM
jgi:hypothetical protein